LAVIASSGPTAIQEFAQMVASVAALIGSLAAAGMLYVNFRKLGAIEARQKRIGRHQGMSDEEVG
jgi:hypothetical protein